MGQKLVHKAIEICTPSCLYHAIELILAKEGQKMGRILVRQMVVTTCEEIYDDKYPYDRNEERNVQISKSFKQLIDWHTLSVDPEHSPVQNHSPEQKKKIKDFWTKHRQSKTYAEEMLIQGLQLHIISFDK